MAYSRIPSQDNLGTASAASVSVSFPANTTFGNLLIATSYAFGVGVASTTIPNWTSAKVVSFVSAADETAILYKIADGTESSVVASSSGATSMGLAIHEFSSGAFQGVQTILDQTNSSTTGSLVTSQGTGAITPAKPNELIVMAMSFPTGGTSAPSFDSGASTMSANGNLVDGFLISLNTNTVSPTASWTGLSVAGGCIVSFFAGSQGDSLYNHLIVSDGMSRSEVAS